MLEWSTDTVWEMVHWGPLLKNGEELLTFLALTSGVDGWVRLIFFGGLDFFHWTKSDKDLEKAKGSHIEQNCDASRNHHLGAQGPPKRNLQTGQAKSSKEVPKAAKKRAFWFYLGSFRVWSLVRYVLVGVRITRN